MALYTIREIEEYQRTQHEHEKYDVMFDGRYLHPAEGEVVPDIVNTYLTIWQASRGIIDQTIEKDYGDWVFTYDCDSVENAARVFGFTNLFYVETHKEELQKVHDAFYAQFNPVENYDRIEDTTNTTDSTTIASASGSTQVSPDTSELFYNTGASETGAQTDVDGTVTTTSHIHGNIGVTEAVAMIDHSISFFGSNSEYDYLIRKLINNSCVLCI